MKRVTIALVACVLTLASGTAYATGFVWDGGGRDDSWCTDNNWTAKSSYPGELTANYTDTATIADGSNRPMAVVDCSVTYDVNWVLVDAETADCDLTLKIDGGSLTVSDGSNGGYIQLIAGSHSSTVADDATLWVADGTLTVDDLNVDGGFMDSSRGDRGTAYLDFDVAPTINDDVTVTGDANFAIDASTTIGDDLIVGDGSDYSDVIQSGSAELTVSDDMTIQAGDVAGEHSIYKLSSGTLDVNGEVMVQADDSVDATAKIHIAGGTFEPSSLYFWGRDHATAGHAYGQFDVDVEVQSADGNTDTLVTGYVEWDIGSGAQVCAKDVELDNSGTDWTVTGHANTSELVMYSFTPNGQTFTFSGANGGLVVKRSTTCN